MEVQLSRYLASFFHLRVLSDEYARHRRGEGGAFPSLFTPLNLKYHERALSRFFELNFSVGTSDTSTFNRTK